MASQDLILAVGAGAVAVIAYAGNVGGFKTWADSVMKGGTTVTPIPPKPNCYMMGTSCQVCENPRRVEFKGICKGKTQFLQSNTFSTKITFQQACAQVAKDFVEKCNSGQTSVQRCTYPGCTNLGPGAGCLQCRCSNICKSKPNTYAVTDAKGSCFCRPMPGAKHAFAYAGFDNVTVA